MARLAASASSSKPSATTNCAVFKADPANKGVIMDRGLWAWTRHPNYFGDASVWWGLWLITISGWVSLVTVLSPAADDLLPGLRHRGTLTEKHDGGTGRASTNTGQRTSFFVPRPPRSRIS